MTSMTLVILGYTTFKTQTLKEIINVCAFYDPHGIWPGAQDQGKETWQQPGRAITASIPRVKKTAPEFAKSQ